MTKIKYLVFLACMLFFQTSYNTIFGQCNNITISAASTPATCYSNGTITVTIGGTEAGNLRLSNAQFRLMKDADVYANWTTWSWSTDSLIQTFNTAVSGVYKIEMRAFCQNLQEWTKHTIETEVTVQGDYSQLETSVVTPRKSMNCRNTGEAEVRFAGGMPPYAAILTAPGDYTGETSFTTTEQKIVTNGLAPGDYRITVSDACRSTSTKTFTVGTIADDLPAALVAGMLRSGTDCRSVIPSAVYPVSDPDQQYYWNNAVSYYQYCYLLNDVGTKNWEPLSSKKPVFQLPESYRDFCDSEDFLVSYIRPVGCEATIKRVEHTFSSVCGVNVFTSLQTLSGNTNSTAKLDCSITPDCEVSYPATWTIAATATPDLFLDSGILTDNQKVISNAATSKEYTRGVTYIITLTGADNRKFTSLWTPPLIQEQTQKLAGTLSDNNGYSCMNNPNNPIGSSYIYLYSTSGNILPGTEIKYESGPQPLGMGDEGSVYLIPDNYNYTQFYPVSNFPHKGNSYPVSILTPGRYVFEITPPGGSPYKITINKDLNYYVREITYTATQTCNGLRVVPTGGLQLVDASGTATDVDAYFRITSGPQGVYFNPNTVSQGEELLLQSSGTYRMEMLAPNSNCAIAAIDIVYQGLYIDLERSSYYHCEGKDAGFIRVETANGIEPYTYTITNAPGSPEIEPQTNLTGVFPEIGVAGGTYNINVQDACGNSSTVTVTMLDLANANIAFTVNDGMFCEQSDIQINCIALGRTTYQWTGPNGFESTGQKPRPKAEYPLAIGEYSVTVTPENCAQPITNVLEINVLPAPEFSDVPEEILLCVGSGFKDIVALSGLAPDSDCDLEWYNNRDFIINPPTAHSTIAVGRTDYYVSKACKNNECETGRKLIQVIVLPKEECCPTGQPSAYFEEAASVSCGIAVSSVLHLAVTATRATLTATSGSGVAAGSLSHDTVTGSTTTITYTPAAEDAGKIITITAVTDIPAGSACVPATATWQISVPPVFMQSDPASQIILYNTAHTFYLPLAKGGSGKITYLWEQSLDNAEWSIAPGESREATYTTPRLTENRYYRRKAITETCGDTITSDVALVMILEIPEGVYEYYVKEDSAGRGDGSSWENAMSNERFARILPFAPDGVTFHIAAGTYHPVYEQQGAFSKNVVYRTFAVNSSITLIGGYPADAQIGALSDPEQHKTLFDGNTDGETVNNLIYFYRPSLKLSLNGLYIENTRNYAIVDYSTDSELYLDHVTVSNSSNYAVYATSALILKIENSAFYKNKGGIGSYHTTGKTILNNVRFEENAQNTLVYSGSESLEMNRVEAKHNTAQLVYMYGEKLTVTDSDFENNQCNNNVVVSHSSDSVTITNCKIANNISTAGVGGVYLSNSEAKLKIERSVFDGNESNGNSVHLSVYANAAAIDNCIFRNGKNEESQYDAIFIKCSRSDITNSTFENNLAKTILYLNDEANLINNTFTGNKARNILHMFSENNSIHNTITGNESTDGVFYFCGKGNTLIGNIILGNKGASLNACYYTYYPTTKYNLFSDYQLSSNFNPDKSDIIVSDSETAGYLQILDGTYDESEGVFNPNLKNNGGFTPTVALTGTDLPDGKTINPLPLDTSNVFTDQRGMERNNPACLGAYEYRDTIPDPQTDDCPVNPLAPTAMENICFKIPASGSDGYNFYLDAGLKTPVSPSSPVTLAQGIETICISGDKITVTQIADSAYYNIWMVGDLTQGTSINIADNNNILKWGWQNPDTTKINFTITGSNPVRIDSANILVYSYWGTQCGDITPRIYKSDGTLLWTGTAKRICTGNTNSYDKVAVAFGCTLPPGDYYMNCVVTNRTDPERFCLGFSDEATNTTGTVDGVTVINNISSSNGRFFFTDIAFGTSTSSPVRLTTSCPLPCMKPPMPIAMPLTLCSGEPSSDIIENISYDTNNTLIWYADTAQAALASAPLIMTVNDGTAPVITTYYVSQTDAPCESYKASIIVTVNPKPQITSIDTVCNKDGSFTLTCIPTDTTGFWNSSHPAVAAIDNAGNGSVFPDKSGDVTFTFTNAFGCSDTTTVNITSLCGIIPIPRTDECPDKRHKLRPETSDNICFGFKVIPPQTGSTYTIYDAASKGSVIADSLSVSALTHKEVCIAGDKIQTVTPSADSVYYSVWVDENRMVTSPPVNDTTITLTTTTQNGMLSSTGTKTGWFDRSCSKLNMTTSTDAVTLLSADIILGNYAPGNTITASVQPAIFMSDGTLLHTPPATSVSYSGNPAITQISLGNYVLPPNGAYYIQYTVNNINNAGWYNDQVAFSDVPTTVSGAGGFSDISNSNCNGSGVLFNNVKYSVVQTKEDTIITQLPATISYVPTEKRVELTASCPLFCLGNNNFTLSRTQSTICQGDTVKIKITPSDPVDMSQFAFQWSFPDNNLQMLTPAGKDSVSLKVLPDTNIAHVTVTLTDLCGGSLTLNDTLSVYGGKDASFSGLDNNTLYCRGSDPVKLNPQEPEGIFEGDGIVGDEFDPSLVIGGTATITYRTNDRGCISFSRQTVQVSQSDPLTTTFNIVGVSCNQASDGLITVQVQGGEEPYDYQWFDKDSNRIQVDSAGLNRLEKIGIGRYISKVTDNVGCQIISDPISLPIREFTEEDLSIDNVTVRNAQCHKSDDGTLQVSYLGNEYKQEVSLRIFANNILKFRETSRLESGVFTFESLPAGSYEIRLSYAGAEECESDNANLKREVAITQPDPLHVELNVMGTLCENSRDGYIAALSTGGTPSYAYTWNSISPSWTQEHNSVAGKDTLAALPAGEYLCMITDTNGCSFLSDTIKIEQQEESKLSLKSIFQDQRQRCYGVDNSRIFVSLNPYPAFADVKVNLISEGYENEITCKNGANTANFHDLASGSYQVKVKYEVEGCAAAIDTTIEIKRMSQELSIDDNIEIKHLTCFNEPNGEIKFTGKGVVSGQRATIIAIDTTYTLSHTKQEEEDATYQIKRLKSGSYKLKIENTCGHTTEKTVEINDIEPYKLQLDEELSDTFVECPYDFGKIVFTYSGGKYPDSPIRLEYDSFTTVSVIDRIEERVTYNERTVKDTVYVYDTNGFLVRDSVSGNLVVQIVDRIVYDPVLHHDSVWRTDTIRVPVITDSSLADQSGNQFTYSGLNPHNYYIIYKSAESGCSDSVGLTVSVTAPRPVSVRTEVLPVSCLGYSDGIISIYPHREGDPEYYLIREDEDTEGFSYYTATKATDNTYVRSSEDYPLHKLIQFKNDNENKKLEKYNPSVSGGWELIQPVEASSRDALGNFFHANGDTVKVPVWSNRHTIDFWTDIKGNAMFAGVMTIAGLSEGLYKYTIVDTLYNCVYTDTIRVKLPESALHINQVIFDPVAARCYPEKRQVEVSVSGGWGEYVYSFKDVNKEYPEAEGSLWDGFSGGEVKKYNKEEKTGYLKSKVLDPAVYELYVTDEEGCILKYDELINVTAKITVTANPPYSIRCPNDSTVEVMISASGGESSGYIYKKFERQCEKTGILTDSGCEEVIVETDPNSNTFNLPVGTHGLFAYETTGDRCGGYVEIEVENNHTENYLFFKRRFLDLLCYEDQSGVAEVRVSGATPPYTFYHAVEGGNLQPTVHGDYRDTSDDEPNHHYDYYRIDNLTAGKHTLQVEDQNGCKKELEFELKQPEPLVLETEGSPICMEAQMPVKGNVSAKSITGGTTPYLYYVSIENLSIGEAASKTFVNNKFFDVNANPGQQFQYYVKDANGCIAHQPAQLKAGEVNVEKLDFLASTWRYDSDALLLVDISKPEGADSIVYSFGDDDDKIVIQDKRLYTYAVAGNDSLMSLAGKDLKSVPDSFFIKNFEKVIPDSVSSKYTFILLQDSVLMKKIKREEMKNQLVWYKHKVIMTYYKSGCAFTMERDSFMIANSDSLIYNVGNINQKDILNLELSPNPLADGNLTITITFGNKVDYKIDFYDVIGKVIAPTIEGKSSYINSSMQAIHEVSKSDFLGMTSVVVLITTKRDAASDVLILKK